MKDIIQLHQALSDETRVRLLLVLRVRSFCVCELTELLDLSQTNISKHLSKLRNWGLVDTNRRERFIEYSVVQDGSYLESTLTMLEQELDHHPILLEDRERAQTHWCVSCNPRLIKT